MKKLFPVLMPVLLCLFLFSSCKKSTTTAVSTSPVMTFSVDGVASTTYTVSCAVATAGSAQTYTINSQGNLSTYPQLTLYVVNPTVGGTYTIGTYGASGTAAGLSYIAAANSGSFNSVSGQLVITAISSTTITGTFQAACSNTSVSPATTRAISSGSFTAPILQ